MPTTAEEVELDRRWWRWWWLEDEEELGAGDSVARLRNTAVGAAAKSLHHTFLVFNGM